MATALVTHHKNCQRMNWGMWQRAWGVELAPTFTQIPIRSSVRGTHRTKCYPWRPDCEFGLGSDLSRHGHRTSGGVWHQGVGRLRDGASMDWTWSGRSQRMLDRIRICRILETLQHPELFVMLLGSFRSSFLWCVRVYFPAGRGGTDIREYFCHYGVYLVLVVCVKWHPYECQDLSFPCRTLHLSGACGWSAYIRAGILNVLVAWMPIFVTCQNTLLQE